MAVNESVLHRATGGWVNRRRLPHHDTSAASTKEARRAGERRQSSVLAIGVGGLSGRDCQGNLSHFCDENDAASSS